MMTSFAEKHWGCSLSSWLIVDTLLISKLFTPCCGDPNDENEGTMSNAELILMKNSAHWEHERFHKKRPWSE